MRGGNEYSKPLVLGQGNIVKGCNLLSANRIHEKEWIPVYAGMTDSGDSTAFYNAQYVTHHIKTKSLHPCKQGCVLLYQSGSIANVNKGDDILLHV